VSGVLLWLNGPINAGKTTVARLLARRLPGSATFEGDDVAEAIEPRELRWQRAVERTAPRALTHAKGGAIAIAAYPLRHADWQFVLGMAQIAGVPAYCITLDPGRDVALADRGERRLTAEERARIVEMYAEGYHERPFSDVIVLTDAQSAEATAEEILWVLKDWLVIDPA
jgi:thymidylate kinase